MNGPTYAIPMNAVTLQNWPVIADPQDPLDGIPKPQLAGGAGMPIPQPTGTPPTTLQPAGGLPIDTSEPQLVPMTPRDVERWRHEPRVLSNSSGKAANIIMRTHSNITLDPEKPSLVTSQYEERGWRYFINPEGVPHFYHAEKHVLTDANLNPPIGRMSVDDAFEALETCIECIRRKRVPTRQSVCDPGEELVLQVYTQVSQGRVKVTNCRYYFASAVPAESPDKDSSDSGSNKKTERRIFWVQPVAADVIYQDVPGVANLEHLSLELTALYWKHWAQYPMERGAPPQCVNELRGTLMCYNIDARTSTTSTVPYATQDLSELAEAVSTIKDIGPEGGYSAWTLGRIMYTIYHERFINFHGQHEGRFSSNQRLHRSVELPTSLVTAITYYGGWWLFDALNILLFMAPRRQFAELSEILVDRLVNYDRRWTVFIEKTKQDWSNYVVVAAIILASDMAFLAIPDVAGNSGDNSSFNVTDLSTNSTRFTGTISDGSSGSPRSPSEVLGYVSVIFSMACIISALFHGWRHNKPGMNAEKVANDLERSGMRILALQFSLPYAMLLWSIVTFAAAFISLGVGATNTAARNSFYVVLGVTGALVVWSVLIDTFGGNSSASTRECLGKRQMLYRGQRVDSSRHKMVGMV